MLKRLVTLPFVTFFSLSCGFIAGILLAPSSGSETRLQMSLFMEQNQQTIKQGFLIGQETFSHVIDFLGAEELVFKNDGD